MQTSNGVNNILLLIFGILVGGTIVAFWFARCTSCSETQKATSFNVEQAKKKKENMAKILQYLASRAQVSNNDIEQLLKVSNATAERYLDELEQSGLLVQIGRTGVKVIYKKSNTSTG